MNNKTLLRNVLNFSGIVLCLLVLICCATPVWATNYYVDQTHGSDRSSGTSPQAAWQHLSVVNRFARDKGFKPGDAILLKSGERWREQLEITGIHGKEATPIRISHYGTGELPTIDAADLVSGWTHVSGPVYQASAKQAVYKVFVDGDNRPSEALAPVVNVVGNWQPGMTYQMWDFVQNQGKSFIALQTPLDQKRLGPADWFHVAPVDAAQQGDGLANVTQTPGSWWYDARQQRILVHLSDGSNPSANSIQIVTRRYGIRLISSSHVVIDGLRIIHAAKAGITASVADVAMDGAEDNQFNSIQNCIFWNIGDTTSDFSTALNMGGEAAIFLAAGTDKERQPLQGWTITGNAVGIVDSRRSLSYDRDGILISGTAGLVLQNNYVATANALGISVVSYHGPPCTTPAIIGNYLTNNDGNLRISGCSEPTVDSNTIEYSYGYGVQFGGNSSGAKVIRNRIHHIERLEQENAYNGIDCNGGAPGGTMSGNSIAAVWGAEATFEIGCGHWIVENNFFDSSSNMKGGGLTFYIRRESLPGLQFRNNTYHLNPATDRQFNYGAGEPGAHTFHDFTWWQQNIEPTARTSPKPDETLTSPAISSGVAAKLFVKTRAVTEYLRTAPPIRWEP